MFSTRSELLYTEPSRFYNQRWRWRCNLFKQCWISLEGVMFGKKMEVVNEDNKAKSYQNYLLHHQSLNDRIEIILSVKVTFQNSLLSALDLKRTDLKNKY